MTHKRYSKKAHRAFCENIDTFVHAFIEKYPENKFMFDDIAHMIMLKDTCKFEIYGDKIYTCFIVSMHTTDNRHKFRYFDTKTLKEV